MLDFSKPLRLVGKIVCGVETLKEGLTLVRDEDGSIFVVDEMGVVQKTDSWKGDGGLRIENVPEPKDTLVLLNTGDNCGWFVSYHNGQQPDTEAEQRRLHRHYDGPKWKVVYVKVPV